MTIRSMSISGGGNSRGKGPEAVLRFGQQDHSVLEQRRQWSQKEGLGRGQGLVTEGLVGLGKGN